MVDTHEGTEEQRCFVNTIDSVYYMDYVLFWCDNMFSQKRFVFWIITNKHWE